MRKSVLFYDERTMWHNPGQTALIFPVGQWVQPMPSSPNVESSESKRRIKNLMDVSGLLDKVEVRSAPPASREEALAVHPAHYLDRLKALSDNGGGFMSETSPVGPRSYEIALLSAGLAKAAVEAVYKREVDNAYSLSRPPGHHCLPDEAMGACCLANIPIAIESAKKHLGVGKVAVVDWDVHHGNGTQAIYYERPDVLTISIHQDGCFPPGYSGLEDTGEGDAVGTNINIPLMPGSGGAAYLEALKKVVVPALERFEPELIIIANGVDANGVDPLARMMLHSDDYRSMTCIMRETAERVCGGRLAVVHEGGYAEAYTPYCGLAIMEELCGWRTDVEDPGLSFIKAQQSPERHLELQKDVIASVAKIHGLAQ
ncbi:class II histone deacetylase [Vreelandella nigrificans]|uniref:Class II histone deacetylase n=2 Tax=Vreelandella nigrificans TaxID=2042704 RepID=A0A2A4HQC5_9GAMM|nr:class II histone deacetylase [Halomonas nigrificans]